MSSGNHPRNPGNKIQKIYKKKTDEPYCEFSLERPLTGKGEKPYAADQSKRCDGCGIIFGTDLILH